LIRLNGLSKKKSYRLWKNNRNKKLIILSKIKR
jgi:hypothetical protein